MHQGGRFGRNLLSQSRRGYDWLSHRLGTMTLWRNLKFLNRTKCSFIEGRCVIISTSWICSAQIQTIQIFRPKPSLLFQRFKLFQNDCLLFIRVLLCLEPQHLHFVFLSLKSTGSFFILLDSIQNLLSLKVVGTLKSLVVF